MTREQKQNLVKELSGEFSSAKALLVCDYKGLKVRDLEALRNSLRPQDIKIQIVKNTLASIAAKDAGLEGFALKDTNLFVWGADEISVSKIASKFAKDNASFFSIRFGYFDKERVELDHIEAIAKLPSKEELIGMLLSVWTAPARYFVTGLDNLKKKKEEAA